MFSLNARLFDKRFTCAHARLEISRKARHTEYKPAGRNTAQSVTKWKRKQEARATLQGTKRATLLRTNQPNFIVRVICSTKQSIIQEIMALISRDLFRNWWEDMDRYHRELEEHFKRLSTRDDLLQSPPVPSFNEFFRPWKNVMQQLEQQVGGQTTVERDQDKFQVIVDVQQFAPEEITVRTDDKCITVEGKHEEKKDQHGYVSRHFVRRYMLPQGYDIGHVKPSLSSDGVLTITAPKLVLPAPGERIVPIERSNGPAIKAA